MPLRNRRPKLVYALVVTQIGCLAIGSLLHHRLVVSALSQAAEEEASAQLAADAEGLLAAVSRLDLGIDVAGPAAREQLDRLLRAQGAIAGVQLVLVDSTWHVLTALGPSDTDAAPHESAGQTLVWARPPGGVSGDADRIAGLLVMGDGRDVALGHRLSRGNGYVFVHRPVQGVKVAPMVLSGSLLGVSVIAWCWTSVLAALATYLMLTKSHEGLTRNAARTETAALRSTYSLVRTRDAVIFGLAKLSESRDETTGHHLERIAAYVSRLAVSVRYHPKYCDLVTPEFIDLIGISSALHDIGKVGIEDSILLKPGALTKDEWARMKEHSSIGGDCLLEIEEHLGGSNFLQMAREIALSHHERWDGTGYPQGLAGEEIPLAARIVAIADVYDALSTRRPYKEPMPHKECIVLIRDGAASQFDPDLVEAFLRIESSFRQIAREYCNDSSAGAESAPDWSADWQQEALDKLEAVLKEDSAASMSSRDFE